MAPFMVGSEYKAAFMLAKLGVASVLWWGGDTGEVRGVMSASGVKMALSSKLGA